MAVEEELWRGSVQMLCPVWQRRESRAFVGTGYDMTHRRNTRPFASCADDEVPTFPDQGRFTTVRLSLGVSNLRSYLGSISPEEGGSLELSLRAEHPRLGSSYRSLATVLSANYYLRNPWLARHVLALDLFAGHGRSSYRRRRLFSIGGLPTRDPLLDLFTGRLSGAPALRGFPAIAFAGNSMVSAHAEYRLPIADLERGHETLPLYWRALHAALFLDTALVADKPRRLLRSRRASIGAELRVGLLFAHVIPTTIRIGYGNGLGRDRRRRNFFLVIGQSF
jgi:outer membrane protein assembly factor BamA